MDATYMKVEEQSIVHVCRDGMFATVGAAAPIKAKAKTGGLKSWLVLERVCKDMLVR